MGDKPVTAPRVRAFYAAAIVPGAAPPYNTLNIKLYYPCLFGDSFAERDTGVVPADSNRAPFPVVIMMPGINLSPEAYSWLAHRLADAGLVTVAYSWIGREMEDRVSITPGVDIEALHIDNYGKRTSCPALPALIEELQRQNQRGTLAGLLDLDQIVLGGHSAGGTMALLNANPDWFAGVRGGFSYAAHTAANQLLGWPEDAVLPLHTDTPLLLIGGSDDGVIANSAHRYGEGANNSPIERIERSFDAGISGARGDRHLVIVEGANHFSLAHPADTATGRAYLEQAAAGDGETIRAYLGDLITSFCLQSFEQPMSEKALGNLLNPEHPLVAKGASK